MWQKLGKSYPPQIEILPLFLLFLNIYLTATNYAGLPDSVPTHFNLQGVPDEWGSKGEMLVFPIMGAVIYIFLTVINVLFGIVKDPRTLINLPPKVKKAMNVARLEELRVSLNRSLFVLKILIEGLLLFSTYMTISVALQRADDLGAVWFMFLVAILAVAGYMVWKSFSLANTSGPKTPHT